jgi:hypothetical protein
MKCSHCKQRFWLRDEDGLHCLLCARPQQRREHEEPFKIELPGEHSISNRAPSNTSRRATSSSGHIHQ